MDAVKAATATGMVFAGLPAGFMLDGATYVRGGELGFDGADAATPAPGGDLTPAECRAEAGPGYVLSGGVPPGSFHASVPLRVFDEQVEAWLDLRRQSPALIIAPGDQLPPDGELDRVTRLVARAAAARL